jgi:hypothetical protein
MSDCSQRLQEALDLVTVAMNKPNAFENSKESTFSALRRGCLDLRKSIDILDSDDFPVDKIRDAWLFLIELSRAKLRRKHAIECINIMLQSPRWGAVLRNDALIQEKIPSLAKEMQTALGFHSAVSPSISPAPAPSTARKAPTGIVRNKSSILAPALNKSKSSTKPKRAISQKTSPVLSPALPARMPSIESEPSAPPEPVVVIEEPSKEPPVVAPTTDQETNPFRLDLNPFKDSRGLKQASNPYARRARGPCWWETNASAVSADKPGWWS